jgi:hypothetical protein
LENLQKKVCKKKMGLARIEYFSICELFKPYNLKKLCPLGGKNSEEGRTRGKNGEKIHIFKTQKFKKLSGNPLGGKNSEFSNKRML